MTDDRHKALALATSALWATAERLRDAGHLELAEACEALSNRCSYLAREGEVTREIPVEGKP